VTLPSVVNPLELGDVRLHYRFVDSLPAGEYDAALATLSTDERERASRFVFEADRQRFVAAHLLARQALSSAAAVDPVAWRFVAGPAGKPRLADEFAPLNLSFNLSHAKGIVACAVSGTEIGVDVEPIDRRVRPLEIASRFFSPPEVAWLRASDDEVRQERFFSLWTLKESYIKAMGVGLSHALDTFGFALGDPPQLAFQGPEGVEASRWYFALYEPAPRFRMAVCVDCAHGTSPRIAVSGASDGRPIGPVFSTRQARPASLRMRS
jgi:4'-phosphopantetheinyl transferase